MKVKVKTKPPKALGKPKEEFSPMIKQLETKPLKPFASLEFLAKWYPTALVLVQEARSCKNCGRSQVVTSRNVLVEYTNNMGAEHGVILRQHDEVPPAPLGLPQKKKHVVTQSEACIHCFNETYTNGQLALFPMPPKPMIRRVFQDYRSREAFTGGFTGGEGEEEQKKAWLTVDLNAPELAEKYARKEGGKKTKVKPRALKLSEL